MWLRDVGDGVSSFPSRMTQGTFVGHHDRTTGAVFVYYQERSCAKQKLDETDTELCMERYVWHAVANGGC